MYLNKYIYKYNIAQVVYIDVPSQACLFSTP